MREPPLFSGAVFYVRKRIDFLHIHAIVAWNINLKTKNNEKTLITGLLCPYSLSELIR